MAEGDEVLLAVRGVRKAYGARPALQGVDLEVRAGEFVALLGPNGAGKSTLFQLLTGLFDADAGELRVCGEDMRRAPVRALGRIGVVFQQMTLDLDLSVEANLVFHARLHGLGGRANAAVVNNARGERKNLRKRGVIGLYHVSGQIRRDLIAAFCQQNAADAKR